MPVFTKPLHLARKFTADDHGRALVWLWDASTGRGRIEAGSIIYVDAPSNLAATVISPSEIRLTATNNSLTATNYFVFRYNGAGQYLEIASIAVGALPYSDTSFSLSTNSYRMTAYFIDEISGNYIISAYSNTATVTI